MDLTDTNCSFWLSLATNELKSYNSLLTDTACRQLHLLTLSLKAGTKPPFNLSPIYVWFEVGTVRVSSFVCLVGIGVSIGSYIIYKICKQGLPQRLSYVSELLISGKRQDSVCKEKTKDENHNLIFDVDKNGDCSTEAMRNIHAENHPDQEKLMDFSASHKTPSTGLASSRLTLPRHRCKSYPKQSESIRSSSESNKASLSNSDSSWSDSCDGCSSLPNSELFETAKDIAMSTTLNDIEILQSQLELLTNDVGDITSKVETLQKRENKKEVVARRYTLGTTEALTDRKRIWKRVNRKQVAKNKRRYMRKLLSEGPDNSCDDFLKSTERLTESADYTQDVYNQNFLEAENLVCSLDYLPTKNGCTANSSAAAESACSSVFEGDNSSGKDEDGIGFGGLKPDGVTERSPMTANLGANNKKKVKRKKKSFDCFDDLYIDDELISPSVDENHATKDRKKRFTTLDQNYSIFQTPECSFLSPPVKTIGESRGADYRRMLSQNGRLNLINNNININLLGELLLLSSHNGPLSPQTSDFLTTCLESPNKAVASADAPTIKRFMEKIGEAVVNFSSTVVPFGKCSGNGYSTPNAHQNSIANNSDSNKNGLQPLLGSLEEISNAFPLWMVENVDKGSSLLKHAEEKYNKVDSSYKGYEQIGRTVGASGAHSVRKDNFCVIRAVLFQAISSNKLQRFQEEFHRNYNKRLNLIHNPKYGFLKNWSFSNRLPYNKGSEVEIIKGCFDLLLDVLNSQELIHKTVNHDQRQNQISSLLDGVFNGCPIIDLRLMEAVKLLMMIEAVELHEYFNSDPRKTNALSWRLFSRRITQTPEMFFKNRMTHVGDTLSLNETELCLLGHTLKVKLEVLRPGMYLGNSDSFVSHYPDEGADGWEKVTLVEEEDGAFVILF